MSARAVIVAMVLGAAVAVACGGRRDAPDVPLGADASTGGSNAGDADAGLPPGVAYVLDGVTCCAKGIGTACCVSPDVPCAQYGGSGHCIAAGGGISGKDMCSICCDGLGTIDRMKLVDGNCVSTAVLDDGPICGLCGDGVCDSEHGENRCNCAQDCPR